MCLQFDSYSIEFADTRKNSTDCREDWLSFPDKDHPALRCWLGIGPDQPCLRPRAQATWDPAPNNQYAAAHNHKLPGVNRWYASHPARPSSPHWLKHSSEGWANHTDKPPLERCLEKY